MDFHLNCVSGECEVCAVIRLLMAENFLCQPCASDYEMCIARYTLFANNDKKGTNRRNPCEM